MENDNLGIKDLAKLADVSIGTVDRVLNNRTGVAPATREKVLQLIKQTGYKKNLVASRLKLAKNKIIKIAVLFPVPRNEQSYWNLPLQGVKAAIAELNEMGVSSTYFYFNLLNHQTFREQIDIIFQEEFSALITVPFFESESNTLLQKAKERKIPIVFLDTERELLYSSNFIRQNSINAGLVAGRLLHGLIGNEGTYVIVNILNDRGKQINNLQRESGFRSYFKDLPNNEKIKHVSINHPLEDEFDLLPAMKEVVKESKSLGIFVTNARSFLLPNILKENNIVNYHLIGFDLNKKNIAYLKSGEIDFLISQKPQYQGYSAIKGLYKYLTEDDKSQLNIDIPVEIVVKENVGYYIQSETL